MHLALGGRTVEAANAHLTTILTGQIDFTPGNQEYKMLLVYE